ncbi:MAG: glycine cleavage system aminomethyltransferase GcvT [Verrucomicrobiota bacterium]|jgi:aminomethyltransferase
MKCIASQGLSEAMGVDKPVARASLCVEMSDNLLHSPLESVHVELGAKMVPFGGWYMPVQYTSILDEHAAVRQQVGVFDISHMGQIVVTGVGAEAWLNRMLANNVAQLAPGQGQYSFLLNEHGGVIDDLIIYREAADRFFAVVNASRIEQDFFWLAQHQPEDVTLANESELWAGLAVQGPLSAAVFARLFNGVSLPPRNGMVRFTHEGQELVVCRTGYTGEDGYEFFSAASTGPAWLKAFVAAGAKPCGLGARDSLRLEMGYPLNGSDLSEELTPLEAGLGFFVDMDKGDFMGREVLATLKAQGLTRKLVGLQYLDKGAPPRAHYAVESSDGRVIGELSSGVLSPSLMTGIAMAYLPIEFTKLGTIVNIDVRGRKFSAKVVKKPFYKPATQAS